MSCHLSLVTSSPPQVCRAQKRYAISVAFLHLTHFLSPFTASGLPRRSRFSIASTKERFPSSPHIFHVALAISGAPLRHSCCFQSAHAISVVFRGANTIIIALTSVNVSRLNYLSFYSYSIAIPISTSAFLNTYKLLKNFNALHYAQEYFCRQFTKN